MHAKLTPFVGAYSRGYVHLLDVGEPIAYGIESKGYLASDRASLDQAVSTWMRPATHGLKRADVSADARHLHACETYRGSHGRRDRHDYPSEWCQR